MPLLGQTMTAVIGNMPSSELAVVFFGWSRTSSPAGPLPLGVAGFGAPGCSLRVSPDWPSVIPGSGRTATFRFTVPVAGSYLGLRFHTQALVLDAAANPLGATLSDAAAGNFGF